MHWRTFLIMLWLAAYLLVAVNVYKRAAISNAVGQVGPAHYMASGYTFGAVALVTLWLVFANGLVLVRAVATAAVVILLSWLLLGLIKPYVPPASSGYVFWLILLLYTSEAIVAGVIMALMRWRGVRLHRPRRASPPSMTNGERNCQFSLASLLWVVGCAAAFLGVARGAARSDAFAFDSICIGGIVGGSAAIAIALVGLRGYVVVRCIVAVLTTAAVLTVVLRPGVDERAYSILAAPAIVFIVPSLAVFRVCGFWLGRVPKSRPVTDGELTVRDAKPASPATPAESRL